MPPALRKNPEPSSSRAAQPFRRARRAKKRNWPQASNQGYRAAKLRTGRQKAENKKCKAQDAGHKAKVRNRENHMFKFPAGCHTVLHTPIPSRVPYAPGFVAPCMRRRFPPVFRSRPALGTPGSLPGMTAEYPGQPHPNFSKFPRKFTKFSLCIIANEGIISLALPQRAKLCPFNPQGRRRPSKSSSGQRAAHHAAGGAVLKRDAAAGKRSAADSGI